MRALSDAPDIEFSAVRFVLTDMDETLTYRGRLSAATYAALERLQAAGIRVIPVTAAPAGWCDQMARMWPVDGVIGENGGVFFRRDDTGHGVVRHFWHADTPAHEIAACVAPIAQMVMQLLPDARLADDQPFRMTSVAFARSGDAAFDDRVAQALRQAGADVTVNNLWVLGWLGGYDKLAMARRVLAQHYGVDIEQERHAILYSGDSTNDAPMFEFFAHTVGVSTVTAYLDQIPVAPRWITRGPGGAGFVEIADAVLAARRQVGA
ncbi:HAD family hydrolase [Burkholderia stagnalis]|uniref:HAD-IIB family hydrolase n=1 Tax=Burkholderia stagnalis TaxID=1503054 RepID=UPI0007597FF9|nr:HAD-IIB family hydrolase [Burkholderia stagnalis]AOK57600.1 HAD family hydrolase [Burkholderia stagnalis]KVN83938.1 HAD family hydrolase [Burkholderia stagnalis]KWO36824.1 HAD family hydrolase [Burkholderia stagnalis]KWO44752.1 HAD family hydrolase [Burkholderia stagnalis]